MRIIAGRLGGRQFNAPSNGKTHPMSEKICGALFNILGDLNGLYLLDAFAGSGALSFEAISRGAEAATAVEIDRTAQTTIAGNIQQLGISGQVTLVRSSVGAWLRNNPGRRFDVVLCDPPYDDLQETTLRQLTERIDDNGLFVLSWPGKCSPPVFSNMEVVKQRLYGDAQLLFYRRSKSHG